MTNEERERQRGREREDGLVWCERVSSWPMSRVITGEWLNSCVGFDPPWL